MNEHQLITRNPNVLGGTPVFTGTRVPVQALFDYLEGGEPLDVFLDHFPMVERSHAIAVLELLKEIAISQVAVASAR